MRWFVMQTWLSMEHMIGLHSCDLGHGGEDMCAVYRGSFQTIPMVDLSLSCLLVYVELYEIENKTRWKLTVWKERLWVNVTQSPKLIFATFAEIRIHKSQSFPSSAGEGSLCGAKRLLHQPVNHKMLSIILQSTPATFRHDDLYAPYTRPNYHCMHSHLLSSTSNKCSLHQTTCLISVGHTSRKHEGLHRYWR